MGLKFTNLATEGLAIFAVLFGPWAFGSSERWATWVLNDVGFALGGLWVWRMLLYRRLAALRLETTRGGGEIAGQTDSEPLVRKLLLGLTGLLLLYFLIGAINARAVYHLWHFTYRPCLTWLPHSYDAQRSWDFFWQYLALAGYFWGLRDWWLEARTRRARLPGRLQRWFWVLVVNGTVLAGVSLIQHFAGENKLLWLVEPQINKQVSTQFGPYAYHANGAQYFNLLWPVGLAFWLYLHKYSRRADVSGWRRHRGKALLGGLALMAVCPLVSLSRAGAAVLLLNLVFAGGIVWLALRKSSRWDWLRILLAILLVLGVGAALEWDGLMTRFDQLQAGYLDRLNLYIPEWQMALDNQPFGTGGGTFSSLYQFYRYSYQDPWWAQAHNDWLEAVITLGWVGLGIALLPFGLILIRCRFDGGIRVRMSFIALVWVALGGCLLHSCVDFPFQIESILVLFTMLCSLLSVFSKR